jgi:hypothetical protein
MRKQQDSMERVKPQPPSRDFSSQPFRGTGIDPKTGRQDIAGAAFDFDEWVQQQARDVGCGAVVSTTKRPAMTVQQIAELRFEMAQNPVGSNAFARKHATLIKAEKEISDRNKEAQTVNGIMRRSMIPEVWGPIERIIRDNPDSPETALQLSRAYILRRFQGLPYQRKEDLMAMLAEVGGCIDIEDMLVVLSRFQYIFGHTAPWLQHEVVMRDEHGDEMVDEDGHPVTEFVLYDPHQPLISEDHKCRMLADRLGHPSLAQYRKLAQDAARQGRNFADLAVELEDITQHDTTAPVVREGPPTRQAMSAAVEDPAVLNACYAAGYEASNKRQRLGQPPGQYLLDQLPLAPHPMALQPFAMQPASQTAPPGACHYWNGERCDFEQKKGMPCRFGMSHHAGRPTQGHSLYVAKPLPGFVAEGGVQQLGAAQK